MNKFKRMSAADVDLSELSAEIARFARLVRSTVGESRLSALSSYLR